MLWTRPRGSNPARASQREAIGPRAAARCLRTLPSQVLLHPLAGRSHYERPKHRKFPSRIPADHGQAGRAPHGRANQTAARRADRAHAVSARRTERPEPAGDRRHDHVRRPVPRPPRPGYACRRIARLPVRHADPAYGRERHGWCGLVRHRPRARCRQARRRRRACISYICSRARPRCGLFGGAPARRAFHLPMDGRTRRNAVGRPRLWPRDVRRCGVHLHAQSAR